MKRLLLLLGFVLVAGLASGVGETEVEPAPGADDRIEVTDSAGITVAFDRYPARVISAAPNVTETIFALGKGDALVGRTDFCDYPPGASSVPSIGNLMDPNLETIVELQPDVVIASTHFQRDVAATLNELGIPVLYFFDPKSFEGTYEIISRIGAAIGAEAEAERVVGQMRAEVAEVLKTVEEAEHHPSVYYAIDFGQWGDFTAGGDTFLGRLLEMAGGDNIASDLEGWSYSFEKIVEADPDLIICSVYWDARERLLTTDGYKDLRAVAEGRVYEIDNNLVDRQGPRLAEGLRALAEIIHPELF